MHTSRTSGAPVAYSSTGDVSGSYRAGILGSRLNSDVYRPPSEGAGVGYGPVVDVTALWSN